MSRQFRAGANADWLARIVERLTEECLFIKMDVEMAEEVRKGRIQEITKELERTKKQLNQAESDGRSDAFPIHGRGF